jgi:hypothetical protein
MIYEHSLLKTATFVIICWNLIKVREFFEIVGFTLRVKFFCHHSPLSEALPEVKAWKLNINQFDIAFEFFES